jgi:cell division cycle 20-like protein 1 (cofactor of APC complex)
MGENFSFYGDRKKGVLHFKKGISENERKKQLFEQGVHFNMDFLSNGSRFNSGLFLEGRVTKRPNFNSSVLKVIDAPGLVDNFYYNVTSFGKDNKLLVALGSDLHLFDYHKNATNWVYQIDDEVDITSISNHDQIDIFALGLCCGEVQLLDLETKKLMRRFVNDEEEHRVVATSFKDYILGHGTRFGEVILYDIRTKGDGIANFSCHKQEVCSLKFSPFNDKIFATGGNDNKIVLYDLRKMKKLGKMSFHKAAVKALSFSKTKENELLSGGGYGDQTLCKWDIIQMKPTKTKNLQSQICNLEMTQQGYVVTTHGWPKNQIEVRDLHTMELFSTFLGHSQRVLHLSINQNTDLIVTGSGDQTLRFWNVKNIAEEGEDFLGHPVSKFERLLR